MTCYSIRQFGDQVLKEKCLRVDRIDKDIKKLVKEMATSMYEANGLGLAAPQLGILKQVIVLDVSSEGEDLRGYVNPEILWYSKEKSSEEEGCLSLGTLRLQISRPSKITFRAIDIQTKKLVAFDADEWLSRVLQHEVDHLNGITIIDKADKEEKKKALKELNLLASIPRL